MIIKVCQFKARPEKGEKLIQIFHPGEMDKAASFFSMGKTASPLLPDVQHYLENIQKDPSKIHVLVNALGAGEFWSSNINGDYFPEPSLIHKGQDYGFETFYKAFPYKHHVNKDPTKSFGRVELSVWNDAMKRVELVIVIDRNLAQRFAAQDVVDKLDQGMYPDVSMGCKVPYDMCSVCLDWPKYRRAQSTFDPNVHQSVGSAVLAYHRRDPIRGVSVTRNDYCPDLKNKLNKILPDGKKVYAINDYPKFFDISFVFIGADKTAKVMAKLASVGTDVVPSWQVAEQMGYNYLPEVEKSFEKAASWVGIDWAKPGSDKIAVTKIAMPAKRASQGKAAEIIKDVVPSQFGGKAVSPDRPDLPNDVLDQLGKSDLSQALSTPTTMGMLLKPREFQRITIIRLGNKPLADRLDDAGSVFSPTEESDHSVPMGPDFFSSLLKSLLIPHMEGRSCLEPVVNRKIVRVIIQGAPDPIEKEPKLASATDPFLRKIAAAYNGYLDRVVDCLCGSNDAVNNNADLWEAVWREGPADLFYKTADYILPQKVDPKILLGSIGGMWLLSQIARWRQRETMSGKANAGVINDVIADNPKLLMAAAGLAALHHQGSGAPGRLLSAAKGLIGVK
jgi:hypothetical protein